MNSMEKQFIECKKRCDKARPIRLRIATCDDRNRPVGIGKRRAGSASVPTTENIREACTRFLA